jgi:hypothetical protein
MPRTIQPPRVFANALTVGQISFGNPPRAAFTSRSRDSFPASRSNNVINSDGIVLSESKEICPAISTIRSELSFVARGLRGQSHAVAIQYYSQTIVDEAPWVFLYQPDFLLAMRANVKGYTYYSADRFTRYKFLFKE